MTPPKPVPPSRRVEVLRAGGKVGVVLGTLLMLAIGAALFYGVVHQPDLGVGGRIIGSFFGLVFGGLGLLFLVDLPSVLCRHTLVFDHEGLGYEVTYGRNRFRLSWTELRTISVSSAERSSRTNHSTLVRLILVPVDADAFAARHEEIAQLRSGEQFVLPLGPNPHAIAPLAEAIHTYAGARDGGVGDDGRATGWTYR